ncbi:Myb-like protein L [Porphyridium purpureum]|uniref:Myb-like protein L n=1 Tax=Porphyridium purpureum TaxID=35688 RepID=A0A5J4YL66_PORPP|nr:Myb-like protein L [Porphyridium purpureum]|eukprot:POR0933..scf249_10
MRVSELRTSHGVHLWCIVDKGEDREMAYIDSFRRTEQASRKVRRPARMKQPKHRSFAVLTFEEAMREGQVVLMDHVQNQMESGCRPKMSSQATRAVANSLFMDCLPAVERNAPAEEDGRALVRLYSGNSSMDSESLDTVSASGRSPCPPLGHLHPPPPYPSYAPTAWSHHARRITPMSQYWYQSAPEGTKYRASHEYDDRMTCGSPRDEAAEFMVRERPSYAGGPSYPKTHRMNMMTGQRHLPSPWNAHHHPPMYPANFSPVSAWASEQQMRPHRQPEHHLQHRQFPAVHFQHGYAQAFPPQHTWNHGQGRTSSLQNAQLWNQMQFVEQAASDSRSMFCIRPAVSQVPRPQVVVASIDRSPLRPGNVASFQTGAMQSSNAYIGMSESAQATGESTERGEDRTNGLTLHLRPTQPSRGEHKMKLRTRKSSWSPEEDKLLLAEVQRHGKGVWKLIAREKFSGPRYFRTSGQLRTRYVNQIMPSRSSLIWVEAEDAALLSLHARHGTSWTHIAQLMGTRTENDCKNRFRKLMRQMKQEKRETFKTRTSAPELG